MQAELNLLMKLEVFGPIVQTHNGVKPITFSFLISLTFFEGLDMHLTNVITIYLYESIDNDIYIKSLKDLNCLKQIIRSLIVCAQSNYNDLYMY